MVDKCFALVAYFVLVAHFDSCQLAIPKIIGITISLDRISDDSVNEDLVSTSNEGFKPICECMKQKQEVFSCSFKSSSSYGCVLCSLYCTIYRLSQIGPDLWSMQCEEIRFWLSEISSKCTDDDMKVECHGIGNTIYSSDSDREYCLQSFCLEGK